MATKTVAEVLEFMVGDVRQLPVIASDVIYQGSAVGENASGYSRPLAAGDPFQGFCMETVDNSSGAAGDKNVMCLRKGCVKLAITSIAIASNDQVAVYASDDNTFTTTKGSNTLIGHVSQFISTGYVWVEFDVQVAAAETSALAQAIAADA